MNNTYTTAYAPDTHDIIVMGCLSDTARTQAVSEGHTPEVVGQHMFFSNHLRRAYAKESTLASAIAYYT